jgi:hypothetical protein
MSEGQASAILARWREAEQNATPGPWESDVIPELNDRPVVLLPDPGNDDRADLLFAADAPQATEADAEFIAVARTALPLAIGALEAVLKLADDWSAKAAEIGAQIELEDCEGATAGFKMIGHMNHRDHAAKIRAAITAALAGKEANDEHG